MPRVKKEQLVEQIKRLTEELVKRRFVGDRMSNVCYNLAQRIKEGHEAELYAELYDELRRSWDAIKQEDL